MAGPILAEGQFGITIFNADNQKQAKEFTESDPAVKKGIVKPGVHPFRIFLKGEK